MDESPDYPGDGEWGLPQFEARDAVTGVAVAVIHPDGGDPWVLNANFLGVGELYATPDPNVLCLAERMERPILINVADPSRKMVIDTQTLRVASALDEQLLLLGDWQKITAWAADGVRWVSEPIVEYDLHIRRTDNGRIVCTGTNYEATRQFEVTLDAATGRVID